MPEIVLASTSPYRRALMARLGVPFRCRAPGVDEETFKQLGLPPRELAERLAVAKADAVAAAEPPDAIVVGGDQLVSFDGVVFGKPGSAERAADQLAAMAGRTHELITALAVRHAGDLVLHTDLTRLRLRPLAREEIVRYIAADLPLDCAGSYKLEERGIVLFDRIEGDDPTAVTGLPLIALTSILRGLGVALP